MSVALLTLSWREKKIFPSAGIVWNSSAGSIQPDVAGVWAASFSWAMEEEVVAVAETKLAAPIAVS